MPKRIVCYAYDQVMSLDVVGPLQVFASANDELERTGRETVYECLVAAKQIGPVKTSSGVRIHADCAIGTIDLSSIDTLLIPGGDGISVQRHDLDLRTCIQDACGQVFRIGSVCSGALVLAEAGVLDGKLATTHWSRCEEMARSFPNIDVKADRLHSYDPTGRDGDPHIFTSAGVTAGIDLALALVEADLGRQLALAVARRLVMFLKRPGGQAQFSSYLIPDGTTPSRLTNLLEWLPANLASDLTLEELADRAGMSARTFSRVFTREMGLSPVRYVERIRLEAARILLHDGALSVSEVAVLCGFRHGETMRRTFQRYLSVSPQEYADRFSGSAQISVTEPTQ
ncbi:GlxA family transcriptional regulator [Thalassospira sp. MA62]|nr:GlxA family transcriptional regulator [Thalassospira sp. MA62]